MCFVLIFASKHFLECKRILTVFRGSFKMNNLKGLLNLTTQLARNSAAGAVPSLTFQFQQLRFRRVFPLIRGHPHPLPANMVRPESSKYNWEPILPPDGKYTIMPLKIKKLAGRHPETGRVVVKTLGGGNKKYFRWIDYDRSANPDGTPKEEKVYNIRYDPLRSTKLALVAGGKYHLFLHIKSAIKTTDAFFVSCRK